MTKIKNIIQTLTEWAPPAYQASYDNAQLLTGDKDTDVSSVLVTLDCTEEIVDEAIQKNANLIVAHHPIIFGGLKSLTGKTYIERTIIKAIKNDIAIYAIHTNLDSVSTGVNKMICDKLGLNQVKILDLQANTLKKLTTYCPESHTKTLIKSLNNAGAGNIGNYENCAFQSSGTGQFKPNKNAQPFVGKINKLEYVTENKIEVLYPSHLEGSILKVLKKNHPYEEVAYYATPLSNLNQEVGSGMVGELDEVMNESNFLKMLKKEFNLEVIQHTQLLGKQIKRVAVCGGAGSFLLQKAIGTGADIFITADFKYHEFFDAEKKLIIADIGHYESEVFTKDLICKYISKKFTNIAVDLSEISTNPIYYYT